MNSAGPQLRNDHLCRKTQYSNARAMLELGTLEASPAMLLISCDTCGDNIANLFAACFDGVSRNYRVMCCNMGWEPKYQGEYRNFLGGCWPPQKVLRDMGYPGGPRTKKFKISIQDWVFKREWRFQARLKFSSEPHSKALFSGECSRFQSRMRFLARPSVIFQGRANHEVQTVNWNTGIFEAESA